MSAHNHSSKTTRTQRRLPFAVWVCQTPAPHSLGLNAEIVAWIIQIMSPPEMRGISSLEELSKAMKLRRTKLRFADDLSWNRACLTAKVMWLEWKGNKKP
jgi:hypothetical protein